MSALRLADPDTFVDGVPHALIAQLRERTPVAWQEMEGEPGFWAVLEHADVVHVAREPGLFSSSAGGVVLENLDESMLEMMRQMILVMDPPQHTIYRKPLSDAFRGRIIANMEPRIREISQSLMKAVRDQGTVEFVDDVAAGLPTQVIGELMGLPRQDWTQLHEWAHQMTSTTDADAVGEEPDLSASIDMALYAMDLADKRRGEAPKDDLTSLILGTEFGGSLMTAADFGSFFVQLVTAANDTTTTMLSSGLWALMQHPEQLAQIRSDRSLIPGAVEEILRWANPLHYFRRTATTDVELHGVQIAAGDKVAMYYTAANRDPKVFSAPEAFDIHRSPNPHLSFGIGEHFCLGVHLARMEGRVFFEELLETFDDIVPAGEPVRVRSNLNNAFKQLPVGLGAA